MHPGTSPDAPSDSSAVRHFVLGTAGHIDHGKTALVKALTGIDADRLPEEQRRGMTIELGFAHLRVGDVQFGIVDVPGHERFVRTMVAGAGGIDMVLLVVAADDSVMPQTVEHVEILHLLGVRHGVAAITKIDAVDAEMVEIVQDEVREVLGSTALRDATICPVSSRSGAGIEELKRVLLDASSAVRGAPRRRPFRMCIDRVFTVAGRGTVATGSVLRGVIVPGDALEVFPGGHACRVRDVQSHGLEYGELHSGQRAALNLTGIDRELLIRGGEIATPGYLEASHLLDVSIRCLSSAGRGIKSSAVVLLDIGTTEVPVRVVLIDRASLDPGGSAFAQLRCGSPLTAVHGQRFILRDPGALRTIGGGVVLRPVARRRRRDPRLEVEVMQRLADGTAFDRLEDLLCMAWPQQPTGLQACARAGIDPEEVEANMARLREAGRIRAVAGIGAPQPLPALEELSVRVRGWLERFHRRNPDQPGRPREALIGYLERAVSRAMARGLYDWLLAQGVIRPFGVFVCLPEFAPSLVPADDRLLRAMIDVLRERAFQPPSIDELAAAQQVDRRRMERLATLGVAMGELVRIDGRFFLHAEAEAKMREDVARLIREKSGVTVAEIREALGSSRKYVVPFVEYLDRIGFTRRQGDERVLGEGSAG
jgi:selenocysteine-specific elongation factor